MERFSSSRTRSLAGGLLAALLAAGSLGAQPAAPEGSPSLGVNTVFTDPATAHQRQEEHNNYFLPAQVLDLQTVAYATADRPAGLDYDAYSAVGYSLATTMMVVGPQIDENGHRRVIVIDTLETFGSGQDAAEQYVAVYNAKYTQESGDARYADVAPVTKLPLDAIIYTHNHIDHTGGVLGYLAMADKAACPAQDPDVRGLDGPYAARRNCVEIISQEKVVDAVVNTSTVSGRIIQARSFYMYGLLLPNELTSPPDPLPFGEAITNGIGPFLSRGIAGFRLPSRTFANEMSLAAAGVKMELIYVPSETDDELAIFVPDLLNGAAVSDVAAANSGLLFSAEVIQGPAFPNLYSLRGTQFRSPATWYQSVDRLRQYDSWCMVPSHGPPVCQRRNVQRLLTNFRDAIQFTHDQTVRFMNQGYTPDELVELVKVPEVVAEDLASVVNWPNATGMMHGHAHPEDYLIPFYGSVQQAVREIYVGYVGWFEADPVDLHPTPPTEAARRMLALIEGGQGVLEEARAALEKGDAQWAAELATLVIRAEPANADARRVKSEAFRLLGARAVDPNWSDWYFTAAAELCPGGADAPCVDRSTGCFVPFAPVGLISPVIQSAVPIKDWVASWTWQLDGRRAAAEQAGTSLGFWFGPTQQEFGVQGYVLQLRHGIAEMIEWQGTLEDFLERVTVAVSMSQKGLDEQILAGAKNGLSPVAWIKDALANQRARLIDGTEADLEAFFGYFEPWPTCEPPLVVPRR